MWTTDIKPHLSSFAPLFLVDDLSRSIALYQVERSQSWGNCENEADDEVPLFSHGGPGVLRLLQQRRDASAA